MHLAVPVLFTECSHCEHNNIPRNQHIFRWKKAAGASTAYLVNFIKDLPEKYKENINNIQPQMIFEPERFGKISQRMKNPHI